MMVNGANELRSYHISLVPKRFRFSAGRLDVIKIKFALGAASAVMKKFYPSFAFVIALFVWLSLGLIAAARDDVKRSKSLDVSSTLVISQVGSGGGGSGTYAFDYVEIKNVSGSVQSLNGLSLYYGSATGNFASQTTNAFALPNVSLDPGQYYLVQLGNAGTSGVAFPVAADAATTNINLSGTSGKIALVSTLAQNICGASGTPCNAAQLAQIVDWVAYGAAGNGTAGNGEGGTSVNNGTALTSSQGSVRKGLGCTDTDNNNADFDVVTAPVPRNRTSTVNLCAGGPIGTPTPIATPTATATATPSASPTPAASPTPSVTGAVVISQFQTGGGTAEDEFIELHNTGSAPVDLNGFRLVYRSATGSTDVGPFATWSTSTILQPGQYYLIGATAYDGAATPDLRYSPSECSCSMSGSGGGLALRPSLTGTPVDSVGWGTATNAFVETSVTTAPPTNDSRSRTNNGCQDSNNNASDFAATSPASPRNSVSAPFVCGGDPGANLFASIGANPTVVVPGASTLLTVTVTPATTPPSTGVTVVGNLAAIGGSGSQTFYDNGTNGDVTSGDNVFSYQTAIPLGFNGGQYNITAVASDLQSRSINLSQNLTVNAPFAGDDPLLLGNPSYATGDVANENNYLMFKPQYTLSYNRSKAVPNWVAWRLDTSWLGTAQRQDDFRPDPALPADWYHVTDNDYSQSGFSRGHMTPSGDRTRSIPDNSATFLMTNMVPQAINNNSGPWQDLEDECRQLAQAGNELYIISGGNGVHPTRPTIAGGRVAVPAVTWKVVLVIPNGSDDLRRINRSTRVFGVIMPNLDSIVASSPWRQYRVTVDAVENLTGFNFFSEVPRNVQEYIESRRDTL
jgi:DNA/RNA endonuclease G (NUC1)